MKYQKYRVLYPYSAKESDELPLIKDDVVDIIGKNEDPWWQVSSMYTSPIRVQKLADEKLTVPFLLHLCPPARCTAFLTEI
jgi:hypothetical protein